MWQTEVDALHDVICLAEQQQEMDLRWAMVDEIEADLIRKQDKPPN